MDAEIIDRMEITDAGALWAWLENNAASRDGLWLVTYKREQGPHHVAPNAVRDALIAYGWVDGKRVTLDAARTMQMIAPWQQKIWAASARARAERLIGEGLMRPGGMRVIKEAKRSGLWQADQSESWEKVPDDLEKILATVGGARARWDASSDDERRKALRWIARAGRSDLRARRISAVVDAVARSRAQAAF
ncbi:MAG: hypothetical protein GY883_19460 [Shimia sp.]|nr:hypothetical protein [Shimia sp.]